MSIGLTVQCTIMETEILEAHMATNKSDFAIVTFAYKARELTV